MESHHVWVTVIVGGVSAILTLILTKGIDAYERWRKIDREDDAAERAISEAEAARIESGLKYIIGKQDARITHLETELQGVRGQHSQCEQSLAKVTARLELIEKEQRRRRPPEPHCDEGT